MRMRTAGKGKTCKPHHIPNSEKMTAVQVQRAYDESADQYEKKFGSTNVLHYASEAAMPFYLLHMTFSVVTGYFAIQLDAPVAVKYPLIVLVATGSTLIAYELVRRWNGIRWLFGMKPLKQDMPVASNAKLDRQPL